MYLNIVSRVLHEQMLFYFSFIGRILFLCNIIEKCWIERKNQITSRTLDIKDKINILLRMKDTRCDTRYANEW